MGCSPMFSTAILSLIFTMTRHIGKGRKGEGRGFLIKHKHSTDIQAKWTVNFLNSTNRKGKSNVLKTVENIARERQIVEVKHIFDISYRQKIREKSKGTKIILG